jgi:hypothetical protein
LWPVILVLTTVTLLSSQRDEDVMVRFMVAFLLVIGLACAVALSVSIVIRNGTISVDIAMPEMPVGVLLLGAALAVVAIEGYGLYCVCEQLV